MDKDDHVLAVAIIDFIRQYTWDKQLETWVKGSGILGGGGKVCQCDGSCQVRERMLAK